ncbi:hypothetical protein K469DRAFT_746584 [Zopfia rhizophila CBS 207.26]|uniref:Uncharacterized protein n=1 Tax=Zopfia rhizophila CBS 207.26 TaxID=1314779 RepID=A0A6A6EHI9_9PEZI|nr:hypothetical protein K469DRAFT_746584 [Zopfia rhizophila CBS 207.26]
MSAELAIGIASLGLAAPPTIEPVLHCKVVTQYRNIYKSHEESLLQLDTHLFQIQQFTSFISSNYDRFDNDTRALYLVQQYFLSTPSSLPRLDSGSVDLVHFTAIPYSRAMFSETPKPILLETHISTATKEDVRDIAAFLQNADLAVISNLKCRGFHGHTLLLSLPPPNPKLVSLQKVLYI